MFELIASSGIPELFLYGIKSGCIIAMGAIGVTLIYGILNFANFAHGDLMALAAYVAFFLVRGVFPAMGIPNPIFAPFSIGLHMLLAIPIAVAVVSGTAISIDLMVFKRLRDNKSQAVFIAMASLGISFVIRSGIYILWGGDSKQFVDGMLRPAIQLPLGMKIRWDQILIILTTIVLIILLHIYLTRTKMGKAMRASADNLDLARVSGIDIKKVVIWTWIIGSCLAGVAGILYGIDVRLNPEMGWKFLLPLFAAVILGGIGNVYGALIGGLIIGITQELSTAFLNPAYKPAVAFFLMIIILLAKPEGIFGKRGR